MTDTATIPPRTSRRQTMRRGVALVSGIAVGSILAACGGAIPTAAPSPAEPATIGATAASGSAASPGQSSPVGAASIARKGGTAVYYASQEGSHLIPSFSSFSTVIAPTAPFFNGLTKPGVNLEPLPDLAESWTSTPDGTQWTFKLRKGVKWHDGQPFTAADVKFTWETIAHPDNKTGAQLYSFFAFVAGAPEFHTGKAREITGINVLDDFTLQANLTAPSAPFFTIGAGQYIIPKHILGGVPVAEMLKHPYARAPIGTGPFVFEVWKTGDSIVGKAFDDYFGGRPHLDRVVYRMIPNADANTLITGLKSKEMNAVELSLDAYDQLQGDLSLRRVLKPGRANQYIEFNLAKPLFQDVRVRKALSFALNRQAINDAIWKGRAQIYNSVFPYDWWPTKKDTTLFDNDPEQAKRLLDEAGWKVGSGGLREKEGQKFSFMMYSIFNDWPLVVQQQWKAVGVEMKHQFVDFATLNTQYYSTRTFEAAGLQVVYTLYTDPHYALPGYFLSANNRNSYNNPQSDDLINRAAATNDQEERRKLYYAWQEVIAQDVPHLWLGNPPNAYAYSADLVTPDYPSSYFNWRDAAAWYYKQ